LSHHVDASFPPSFRPPLCPRDGRIKSRPPQSPIIFFEPFLSNPGGFFSHPFPIQGGCSNFPFLSPRTFSSPRPGRPPPYLFGFFVIFLPGPLKRLNPPPLPHSLALSFPPNAFFRPRTNPKKISPPFPPDNSSLPFCVWWGFLFYPFLIFFPLYCFTREISNPSLLCFIWVWTPCPQKNFPSFLFLLRIFFSTFSSGV